MSRFNAVHTENYSSHANFKSKLPSTSWSSYWTSSRKLCACFMYLYLGWREYFVFNVSMKLSLDTKKRLLLLPFIVTVMRNNTKFWEKLIAYMPLIQRGPHRKRRLWQFLVVAGTPLPSRCLATIGGYIDRPTDSPLIRYGLNRKRTILLLCVYSLPR
jgi:hypothetical protein